MDQYSEVQTKEMDSRSVSSSRHQNEPYVHKVGIPPKQNLFKEFKATVKETFFHDDPLRSFKDQTRSRKLILGIQAIFPIVGWARDYNLSKFKGDIIAGLTIASLCIPQLVLANPGPVVIDKLHASNFAASMGENRIFLTVADAVASCSPKLVEEV